MRVVIICVASGSHTRYGSDLTPYAAKVTKPWAGGVHRWTQRYEWRDWRLLCNLSSPVSARSQEGALFAALCAAGCGDCLLCKHAVGLSELAHQNQAKDAL